MDYERAQSAPVNTIFLPLYFLGTVSCSSEVYTSQRNEKKLFYLAVQTVSVLHRKT